jgi:antirestriction protein ArdC
MNNDVYQVITDRIVGLLEKGVVPWQKPWQGGEQMPRNLVSGHEYRGVNVFLLHAMSYALPYWLTYNQARELGGHVKKGERACPVVFWKRLQVEAPGEPGGKKIVPLLRYYSVFNVAQCEDIPPDKIPVQNGGKREHCPIQAAESIVAAMPKKPEIKHGGGRACYSPGLDCVTMPLPETFRSGQDYYSVLFHELTHSTGHESRLNRKGVAGADGEWSAFGSTPYAREELVAEMGAAFLSGHAGIVERTLDNSAAYLQSWLARLKEDARLIVQAAAAAQKAADFVVGKQFAESEGEDGK